MPFKPLLKTKNYFISTAGYVFRVENGREIICKPSQTPNTKEVQVFVNGKPYNLLYLMIEHFRGEIKVTDKIKYTIDKDLRIPETSIIIKSAVGKNEVITAEQEAGMYNYKCYLKANSANARSEQKITGFEVYRALCACNFKCVYCGAKLTPHNWHLDHYIPLSKTGRNVFENLVASCSVCNKMKGSLDGLQFYSKCKRIVEKFSFPMGNNKEDTQEEVTNG